MKIHFFIITFDKNHHDCTQLAWDMNEYTQV